MSTKDLKVETLLVGYSTTGNEETAILTVGKKRKNQSVEIINAIQGPEATELYKKLSENRFSEVK